MYCTHLGNKICYQCASEIYKEMPNGTTNIASQLSAVLMSMFLKLMHGSETQSTKIKLDDLVT
jgi:primosomal protein N'